MAWRDSLQPGPGWQAADTFHLEMRTGGVSALPHHRNPGSSEQGGGELPSSGENSGHSDTSVLENVEVLSCPVRYLVFILLCDRDSS